MEPKLGQEKKKKKPKVDAEGKSTTVAKDFDWKEGLKWFMKHSPKKKKNGNK